MTTRFGNDREDETTLVRRVARAIEDRRLSPAAAAAQIGMSVGTLQGHLRGEHVRSDSARKYADWLAGKSASDRVVFHRAEPRRRPKEALGSSTAVQAALPLGWRASAPPPTGRPLKPHLVVDIFSGCGGLSLGFDLLGGGGFFRTVMALDVQPAAIAVLNRNHGGKPVGRLVDLTEFLDETEVVTLYLDHVARLERDEETLARLHGLAEGRFAAFLRVLAAIDARFLADLGKVRSGAGFRTAYEALDRQALLQTAVVGFHDKLKLPRTSLRAPDLPSVIWTDVPKPEGSTPATEAAPERFLQQARETWDAQVRSLADRREANGRGQLGSSARRIAAFVEFLRSAAGRSTRDAWSRWQAARLALRVETFEDPAFAREVRELYEETYPVSVLLGGPPCQGFSRIGRGKIRSLREASVHVHDDEDAVDTRNLLYQRYLLVVSALRPTVFKFENVQHFQSTVKADGRTFTASEVLAEAIRDMSADGEGEHGLSYEVAARTVDASRHGVPQTRQRFFMSGVLSDRAGGIEAARTLAMSCLALDEAEPVPLGAALAGLPEPLLGGGDLANGGGLLAETVEVGGDATEGGSSEAFRAWIRQRSPQGDVPRLVDAHAARTCRLDDARFFALLGPGKRWMDYRVDDAPTLRVLSAALGALASLDERTLGDLRKRGGAAASLPDRSTLAALAGAADGSLALRMLLEQLGDKLGAEHHLLTEKYLAKRDGHHGDWIARLDATRPCKTIVAHMGKDTYGYVHPAEPRTISVREAARVQTFPDWFAFGDVSLTDAFRMIGNAVPPMLSGAIAERVAAALAATSPRAAFADQAAVPMAAE